MTTLRTFFMAIAVIVGTVAALAFLGFALLLAWMLLDDAGYPTLAVAGGVGSWVIFLAAVIAVVDWSYRKELREHPEKFDEHGEPLHGKDYVRAGAVRPTAPPPKAPKPAPAWVRGGYTPAYSLDTSNPPKGIPPAPAQVPTPAPLQSVTQGKDQ